VCYDCLAVGTKLHVQGRQIVELIVEGERSALTSRVEGGGYQIAWVGAFVMPPLELGCLAAAVELCVCCDDFQKSIEPRNHE